MWDSPHGCRPRSPLRSSGDFPRPGGCYHHTDIRYWLWYGNCNHRDWNLLIGNCNNHLGLIVIITWSPESSYSCDKDIIPPSVCVVLWFHLVGQLTRYHLSHHVHPHPHIMESLGGEKPFQGLDVVPWVSINDVSLRYMYWLEPKHYALIHPSKGHFITITTIVVMTICVKATNVSGLLSCHSFIKPTRHCRSVWPRLIMINIVWRWW